ncbi:MAG: Mg2 transporter protein CorA family protein [Candidatus Magasanikbacteria bacterium GW2011_GWA2_46_17]|uniref:Mg2 transporter protein CorA family protein n=1 Tax=Candidatus Magasanikbacteria bacterium GW2011_GWA2_46_17 TaxID=1619042 RepID=A0A0G1P088_9BACT|nr:MAG: Mg2 transporter protein CorA family protein [Candidatus Magasanikbacteria bacterium GW2011_GWA2_46_17]
MKQLDANLQINANIANAVDYCIRHIRVYSSYSHRVITMKHLHELSHNGLLWVNVTKQKEEVLRAVQKRFGFEEMDIKESLPPFQRPKIAKRRDYYFTVLHFPIFDRESRRLGFTEIDFFLGANYIVTVHDSKIIAIENFFEECEKKEEERTKYFTGTSVHILFEFLSRLLEGVFPILLHVNDDINTVDRRLFTEMSDRQIAEEILRLKTNIVTFRRTMQGHRTVLERLIMYSGRDLDIGSYQNYINSLREFTNEIWHMLESQRESINALHETNESFLSLRTNSVMRTLTIISVITFPLTLIATLFAIRAPGTPFVDHRWGFWIIFGLIISGATYMIAVFKKKGWI